MPWWGHLEICVLHMKIIDAIIEKIKILKAEKFTGRILIEVNMRNGGLADVHFEKREKLVIGS
jgi:hypothetical protein